MATQRVTSGSILMAAALVCLACPAAASEAVSTYATWSVFKGDEGSCYARGSASSIDPGVAERGETYVQILHLPKMGFVDEVFVLPGYSYADGSRALASVDGGPPFSLDEDSFKSFAADDVKRKLVAAMRAGRELEVTGLTEGGIRTTDRYPLEGFTEAYAEIGRVGASPKGSGHFGGYRTSKDRFFRLSAEGETGGDNEGRAHWAYGRRRRRVAVLAEGRLGSQGEEKDTQQEDGHISSSRKPQDGTAGDSSRRRLRTRDRDRVVVEEGRCKPAISTRVRDCKRRGDARLFARLTRCRYSSIQGDAYSSPAPTSGLLVSVTNVVGIPLLLSSNPQTSPVLIL